MRLIEGSGISLYYQLKEQLKNKINKKEWQPGDKIPHEMDLAAQYGISRSTVRQAVLDMVREGLLVRKKGVGTFVAKPKYQTPIMLEFAYPEKFGSRHDIISQKIINVPSEKVDCLKLPEGSQVYELIRLRYFNEEPAAVEVLYLPCDKFPGFFDLPLQGRIFDLLDQYYQIKIQYFDVSIEPVLLNQKERQIFKLNRKTEAALKVTRICFNENGEPYLMHNSIFRGDCCSLLFKSR